ncbi:DUF7544 domain-containing protein [Halomicrobium urmianum]|uniref:DUF7544 domain-containing protein n=1 Tax=Halomicrobium urmianum TaxID=1586233 RepID=UPI001CD97B88|nr:hypothetical protein [Halomicrobium urmianum]
MALSAVDSVDDAIDATKRFLLPFSWGTWLKLAFVMFFVGGGGGGLGNVQSLAQSPGGFEDGDFESQPPDAGAGQPAPGAGPEWLTGELILAVVAAVVVLALLLFVIGQVMQFVFVESLLREQVHVRRYFGRNVGNGLRLLAFRIVLGIVSVAILGGVVLVGALLFGLGEGGGVPVGLGLVALAIPFLFLFAMVVGTIDGFTNVFVVPIMLTEDRGILSAWGRLWSAIKREWKEFLAYLFFSVVLMIGVGILGGLVSLLATLVIAIPFGLVGFGIWTAASGTAMWAGIGVVAALGVLTAIVVSLLIQVPLQSFLRYYALLVLGDADADLDPIPEIRAGVRSDEDPSDRPAV